MASPKINAKVDTVVRGGTVVTSSQAIDAAVAITGEKIVALATPPGLGALSFCRKLN